MQHFRVFILLLLSSISFQATACGFYFEGDVRYCFLKPEFYGYRSFQEFNYSYDSFYSKSDLYEPNQYPNELLWVKYCKGAVSYAAVEQAINNLPLGDLTAASNNQMIRYLYKTNDFEAIAYLKFAKSCEDVNYYFADPWERGEYAALPIRSKLISKAINFSKSVKNPEIRQRYAFQAIRMSYYNRDMERIKSIYARNFSDKNNKDIIGYWSLYFLTFSAIDKPLGNFYAAQVFGNAPDKRFMIQQQYNRSIPIEEVLKFAKTNEEKVNVYLLAATIKTDKALDYIRAIQKLQPESEALGFLLLREINKIDDWVFTPYYTLSKAPFDDYNSEEYDSFAMISARVQKDRLYAGQILQFINGINPNRTDNPVMWKTAKAHLLFVTRQYKSSLSAITSLEKSVSKSDSIYGELERIKALNLTVDQPYGQAVIPELVKSIVLKNKTDKKFIFALGRELEYKGNISDATILYSKMSEYEFEWSTTKKKKGVYGLYFYDYFDYADVIYSTVQLENIIQTILLHKNDKDNFSEWAYQKVITDLPKLYDLLGTKYVRLDKLSKALENFNNIDNSYWQTTYSLWDKDDSYGNNFDNNPFTVLKYTPIFMPQSDFILTKKTVTQRLINYLNKAQNPREKNRDYYYFLAGNCYYNMTIYGNSWMLRRFSWSSSDDGNPLFPDDDEFKKANLAHHYYFLAYKYAKDPKFKALSLRLANRFALLKKKYPDNYYQLCNGCTAFEDYFKARR
ncbi:MAG: hypothetical protein PSV16_03285 [Flavobacterium sp.]|nr:hypothetical protein [Flavobacterium sp.]